MLRNISFAVKKKKRSTFFRNECDELLVICYLIYVKCNGSATVTSYCYLKCNKNVTSYVLQKVTSYVTILNFALLPVFLCVPVSRVSPLCHSSYCVTFCRNR
jgi:hypothetical protein